MQTHGMQSGLHLFLLHCPLLQCPVKSFSTTPCSFSLPSNLFSHTLSLWMSDQFILHNTTWNIPSSLRSPLHVLASLKEPNHSQCFTTLCPVQIAASTILISECLPQCLAKSLRTRSLLGKGLYFNKNAKVFKISFVYACGCTCVNVGQRATLGIIPLLLSTCFIALDSSSRKGWLASSEWKCLHFLDSGITNMGHHTPLYHFLFKTGRNSP